MTVADESRLLPSVALVEAPVRLWVQSALLILVLAIPTGLAAVYDTRVVNDINVWIKPLKFQISLMLHLMTLAALTTLIAAPARDGRLMRVTAWLAAAMVFVEVGYITLQAGRGRASHFNTETAFEAAMYGVMGVGAVVLTGAAVVVGILVLRAPRAGVGEGLRWGAGLGLILGFAATLVVAGYMSSQPSHWVGGVASDAGGLPVMGWLRTGGDLRVSHFFALHVMQVLPLVGWLGDRAFGSGRRVVLLTVPVWLVVVAATFAQAVSGKPLIGL